MSMEEAQNLGIKREYMNLPGVSMAFKQYVSSLDSKLAREYIRKYGGQNGAKDPFNPANRHIRFDGNAMEGPKRPGDKPKKEKKFGIFNRR